MKKKTSKYAITEIITTGLNFKKDKIIHISTHQLNNGKVEDSFSSFINPERTLEPDWSRSVGISNLDLQNAPKFYEVAKRLIALWDGYTLISTNPQFSYIFLKNEYKTLGFNFNHANAHLDSIVMHSNATFCPGTSKAEDIVNHITSTQGKNLINAINLKKDLSPKKYLAAKVKELPNICGVYLLKNEAREIIYVGKALKIRDRIRQHFRDLQRKGFNIHRKVADVDYIDAHSELFALLLELHLIRTYRPELNKALRNTTYKYDLKIKFNEGSHHEVKIAPIKKLTDGLVIKRFRSRKSAVTFVTGLLELGFINPEYLNVHGARKTDFSEYEHLDCEEVEEYNNHLTEVMEEINPFRSGSFLIKENADAEAYCIVEDGLFRGLGFSSKGKNSFVELKENCDHKFSYEDALNVVLNFGKSSVLFVERH